MKNNPPPDYLFEIEDAKILGVRPWELEDVPLFWRKQARTVRLARIEAIQEIAKKNKIKAVFLLDI